MLWLLLSFLVKYSLKGKKEKEQEKWECSNALGFAYWPTDLWLRVFVIPYICRTKVAACAKHFVGDGGTTKGINENNTEIDLHGLLSIHMPAYSDAIIKGVSTVMISYSSWNGEKMHANRQLVTGFLKNTLKFKVRFIK